MCGEQKHGDSCVIAGWGSPPRVRGTEKLSTWMFVQKRITPACAGNSTPTCRVCVQRQDHPRACGEQSFASCVMDDNIGSPPRVRGTVMCNKYIASNHRITPACAGNSFFSFFVRTDSRDHPRVCGEQRPNGQ